MSKSVHELFVRARNRLEGRWHRGWGRPYENTCAVGSLLCVAYGERNLDLSHGAYMEQLLKDYPQLESTLSKHKIYSLAALIDFNDKQEVEDGVLELFDQIIAETAPAPEVPTLEVEQSDGSIECVEVVDEQEEKVLVTV